jgi:phytoene dehydrogenase-like protein
MKVLIVGAGLAGLTCGRELHARGVDVEIMEASDGVGGRVRTDRVQGCLVDRGFQVLFTAYPAAGRQLDQAALDLRRLAPGAIIAHRTHRYILTDPLRDPADGPAAAWSPAVTLGDKLRTARLAVRLRAQSIDELLAGPDTSTLEFLQDEGFSERFINGFIRPFYGGIFLDRSLTTSAKCFKFDFKMLAEGYAALPAGGIGAIPAQLAAPLGDRVRLNTPVAALLRNDEGAVTGVRLADGSERRADAVVIATAAPEAARLTGLPMPAGQVGTVNLHWVGSRPVYRGAKIVLNANPRPFVNNVMQITNVAPEYAPPGRHLLSAAVLGTPAGDDATLYAQGMADLQRMFAGDQGALQALAGYTPLALYRIPYSQFAQPPGLHPTLPDNVTPIPHLYCAAEWTEASSQNAAMISGEKAAVAVLLRHS